MAMVLEQSENITLLSVFLSNFPSISLIGLIAYFAKNWLKALETEAHNATENVNKIAHDYTLKLYDLSEKVHDNLETMLNKFSVWEDKVKKAIENDSSISPQTKQAFLEFSNETRNELKNVKENINKVNIEVGKVFQSFDTLKNSSKTSDHSKCEQLDTIKDIQVKLKTLQSFYCEKCNRNDEMMKKLFELQRKLNDDIKNCERAINTLAKAKGVIRLFDHSDNKKR